VIEETFFFKNHNFFSEKKTLKDLINQLETRITELSGEQQDDVTLKKLEIIAVNQKLEESLKENEKLEESMLTMREEVIISNIYVFFSSCLKSQSRLKVCLYRTRPRLGGVREGMV